MPQACGLKTRRRRTSLEVREPAALTKVRTGGTATLFAALDFNFTESSYIDGSLRAHSELHVFLLVRGDPSADRLRHITAYPPVSVSVPSAAKMARSATRCTSDLSSGVLGPSLRKSAQVPSTLGLGPYGALRPYGLWACRARPRHVQMATQHRYLLVQLRPAEFAELPVGLVPSKGRDMYSTELLFGLRVS